MKFVYTLLLCVFSLFALAQETKTDEGKPRQKLVSARPQIRIYGLYPIHFGDNAFADAYRSEGGFGFNISPLRVSDFRLAVGFEASAYHVRKDERIGDPISESTYRSLFAEVSYAIGSEDSFCLRPTMGIGGSYYYLQMSEMRFGNQNAFDFRAGLTADWAVQKHLSLFLSARYVRSNIDVDTSKELHDYYSKANSVQVGLGIMIR